MNLLEEDKNNFLFKKETYKIIGCAMKVHSELGSGFLEAVYQEALSIMFNKKGIPYQTEKLLEIEFLGQKLNKKYIADFICFDEIIIEATDEIGPSTNIATIAIMLTMIPMAFVGGMMGQFMLPIPLNVPVALGVSLFVAYVFAPFLAKKLIKRTKGTH